MGFCAIFRGYVPFTITSAWRIASTISAKPTEPRSSERGDESHHTRGFQGDVSPWKNASTRPLSLAQKPHPEGWGEFTLLNLSPCRSKIRNLLSAWGLNTIFLGIFKPRMENNTAVSECQGSRQVRINAGRLMVYPLGFFSKFKHIILFLLWLAIGALGTFGNAPAAFAAEVVTTTVGLTLILFQGLNRVCRIGIIGE